MTFIKRLIAEGPHLPASWTSGEPDIDAKAQKLLGILDAGHSYNNRYAQLSTDVRVILLAREAKDLSQEAVEATILHAAHQLITEAAHGTAGISLRALESAKPEALYTRLRDYTRAHFDEITQQMHTDAAQGFNRTHDATGGADVSPEVKAQTVRILNELKYKRQSQSDRKNYYEALLEKISGNDAIWDAMGGKVHRNKGNVEALAYYAATVMVEDMLGKGKKDKLAFNATDFLKSTSRALSRQFGDKDKALRIISRLRKGEEEGRAIPELNPKGVIDEYADFLYWAMGPVGTENYRYLQEHAKKAAASRPEFGADVSDELADTVIRGVMRGYVKNNILNKTTPWEDMAQYGHSKIREHLIEHMSGYVVTGKLQEDWQARIAESAMAAPLQK